MHLITTDEKFEDVKTRLLKVDVLVIDEISMISSKVLNQTEFICRKLRQNDYIFGNIQVILCGEFYQLPPVSNELYGDFGHFCFECSWFPSYFKHKTTLNIIHRQEDRTLISTVNDLEKGTLTDESVVFLNSLSRPLSPEKNSSDIHLFAGYLDSDMHNFEKLQSLPGDMVCFPSEDADSSHYLNKMLAPKNLGLKVSCSVMLLINLSDVLVNGLTGTVTKIENDSIDVNFQTTTNALTAKIRKFSFTTFDPVSKTIVAKRIQFPLKLCYGITIHKSQGMSLDSVVVHCNNISFPGQLGVAIGRATSTDGLQVLNFKKIHCKEHTTKVYAFYENILVGEMCRDFSCYRKIFCGQKTLESNDSDTDAGSTDDPDTDPDTNFVD